MLTRAFLVPRAITLDDFVALNDEIAALTRAGVPLGSGLTAFGRELPGRMGATAQEIGSRLERGESLDRIVADFPHLPPAYLAVVQAGLRVGKLPAALEGISQSTRRIATLRRTIGLALLYPLFVMGIGYSFFCFTIATLTPVMLLMLREYNALPLWLETSANALRETMPIWSTLPPLLLAAWFAWIWWRSGRVAAGRELHPLFSFGALGTLLKMRTAGQMSALCETLALLLEYGVPLPEGLRLASAATGSHRLTKAADSLASALSQGGNMTVAGGDFPPLLGWMLGSGQLQNDLPGMLRRAAGVYRDEATRRAQWLTLYVPIVLTAILGGGTVALYATVTLGPFLVILQRLAEAPHGR